MSNFEGNRNNNSLQKDPSEQVTAKMKVEKKVNTREIDEKPKRFDRVPFYKHTAPGPGWYDLSGETMVS